MCSPKPLDLYLNGCRIRLPLQADMHDSVSLLIIAGIDIPVSFLRGVYSTFVSTMIFIVSSGECVSGAESMFLVAIMTRSLIFDNAGS